MCMCQWVEVRAVCMRRWVEVKAVCMLVGGGLLELPGDAVVVSLPDPADGRDVGLYQVVLSQVWENRPYSYSNYNNLI